jgi:hypothetical protein
MKSRLHYVESGDSNITVGAVARRHGSHAEATRRYPRPRPALRAELCRMEIWAGKATQSSGDAPEIMPIA